MPLADENAENSGAPPGVLRPQLRQGGLRGPPGATRGHGRAAQQRPHPPHPRPLRPRLPRDNRPLEPVRHRPGHGPEPVEHLAHAEGRQERRQVPGCLETAPGGVHARGGRQNSRVRRARLRPSPGLSGGGLPPALPQAAQGPGAPLTGGGGTNPAFLGGGEEEGRGGCRPAWPYGAGRVGAAPRPRGRGLGRRSSEPEDAIAELLRGMARWKGAWAVATLLSIYTELSTFFHNIRGARQTHLSAASSETRDETSQGCSPPRISRPAWRHWKKRWQSSSG